MRDNIDSVDKKINDSEDIRVSLRFKKDEFLHLVECLMHSKTDIKSKADVIYSILELATKYPRHIEKPKSGRGQGRKKGIKNQKHG